MAPARAPMAAMKNRTADMAELLLALASQRRALDRLGQQHLLGEDQVRAGVIGELVVVAHGDGVKRARHLAVAAEDATREIDFIHGRVALTGRDTVLGSVLGRHHTDAVSRACGGTQGTAHALLKARVLETVELVAPPEARVDRRLLLWILDRGGAFDDARERRLHAAQ